jgi:glutamate carboxypeptidase
MKQQLKKQLHFLKQLTDISSTTKDPIGVNRVQDTLTKKLQSLGFETKYYKNQQKVSGNALVAFYQGQTNECITLVGHADTVGRLTDKFHFHMDSINDLVTGPGIADDKGGLVVALTAIEYFLKANPRPYYSLLFVSSPNEEEGSIGFQELFRSIGKKTKFALGMEPALQDGSIINSRNGNRWYRMTLEGIASHAGRFGEAHLNAAHEMALKIGQIHSLSNEDEKVRVNVGSFHGGNGTFNTICEKAEVLIDMRFPCFHKREQLSHNLLEIFLNHQLSCPKTGRQVQMSYSIEDDCPPLNYNPDHQNLIEKYLDLINMEEAQMIKATHSGGASDINYFSTPENFVMDGLGPIAGRLHTKQEYLVMSSLETRANALHQFLNHITQIDIKDDINASQGENNEYFYEFVTAGF